MSAIWPSYAPSQALGGIQGSWGFLSLTKLLGGGGGGEGDEGGYSPHAVAGIKKGAAAKGVLKEGDEIMSVNGTDIVDMHPQAVEELFSRSEFFALAMPSSFVRIRKVPKQLQRCTHRLLVPFIASLSSHARSVPREKPPILPSSSSCTPPLPPLPPPLPVLASSL